MNQDMAHNSMQTDDEEVSLLYKHDPLPDSGQYVRLMQILSSSKSHSMQCTLTTYKRDEAPPYIAISYVWGDPTVQDFIKIDGRTFGVTKNCQFVLRQLLNLLPTSSEDEPYFWIDAISINQKNLAEKGAQVQRMAEVYRAAKEVLSCVGDHENNSQLVFDIIDMAKDKMTKSGFEWLTNPDQFIGNNTAKATMDAASTVRAILSRTVQQAWIDGGRRGTVSALYREFTQAFLAFAERSYWRRLWIMQELHSAKSVSLVCGFSTMSLQNVLLYMAADVTVYRDDLLCMEIMLRGSRHLPPVLYGPDVGADMKKPDFVLRNGRNLQCSQFHDRLYAFLDIIDWPTGARPEFVIPDYTLDEPGVVRQLGECLVQCTRGKIYDKDNVFSETNDYQRFLGDFAIDLGLPRQTGLDIFARIREEIRNKEPL